MCADILGNHQLLSDFLNVVSGHHDRVQDEIVSKIKYVFFPHSNSRTRQTLISSFARFIIRRSNRVSFLTDEDHNTVFLFFLYFFYIFGGIPSCTRTIFVS